MMTYFKQFFLLLLLPATAYSQVSVAVTGYTINAPIDNKVLHLQYDGEGLLQGEVAVHNGLTGNKYLFRGKARNGYLYDTAHWYFNDGRVEREAVFISPGRNEEGLAQCVYIDYAPCIKGLFLGTYKTWDKNAQGIYYLRSVTQYVNGKEEGDRIIYHFNGKVYTQTAYAGGLKNGATKVYDMHGVIEMEWFYRNDLRHGENTWYYESTIIPQRREYYTNGSCDSVIKYNEAGRVISRAISSAKYGWESFKYDDYGHLQSYYMPDSISVEYYASGQMQLRTGIKEWRNDGKYEEWFENGKPKYEMHYAGGIRTGNYTSYYESGKLKAKGQYEDGVKTGTWIHYDEKGRKLAKPTDAMLAEEEEPMLVREEGDIMEEAPQMGASEAKLPGNKFLSQPGKLFESLDTDFLKKYKTINISAVVDEKGQAVYEIVSPMKSVHKEMLGDILRYRMPTWEAFSTGWRRLPCTVNFTIVQRK